MISVDLLAKLGALLIGAVSTFKLVSDWLSSRQGRIREEYKFARSFLDDVERNPAMHPFLKAKGYQAIAGDANLATSEIEYLLTLHDSPRALKDYALGKPYLQHFATAGKVQISYRPKYRGGWARTWRKSWYFALYLLFVLAAFAPLLLPAFKALPPARALTLFAFTLLVFVPPGFLALRSGVRIARAEALVKYQATGGRGTLVAE